MKKGIILGLVAVLAMLILVGCTDGSVAVGDMVRLVDPDGKNIEMHEAASQNSPVMANFEPGLKCEVVFEPRTVADVTFRSCRVQGAQWSKLLVALKFSWTDGLTSRSSMYSIRNS